MRADTAAAQPAAAGAPVGPLEYAFLYISGLFFGSKLGAVLLMGPSADAGISGSVESPLLQLVWLGIYAALGGLAALRWRTSVFLMARSPLIFLLIALAILSFQWSIEPSTTLRRGIAVLGSSAYAVYLVGRLPYRDIITLLAAIFGGFAVLSVVVAIALPQVGVMQADTAWPGYWQGLKYHKNGLGRMAAVGAVTLFLAAYAETGARRLTFFSLMALSVALVLVSRSTTALLVLASTSALGLFAAIYQRSIAVSLITIAAGVFSVITLSIAILTSGGLNAFFQLFGKDATLTGRLPMWDLVYEAIQKNYWLGWGYSSFWREDQAHVRRIAEVLHYTPEYSHNGLMELWLDVGLIGVILFVVVWLITLAKSVVFARDCRNTILSLFPLLYVYSFGISNLTEATILARNSLEFILFVFCALFLNAYRPAQRGGASSGLFSAARNAGALHRRAQFARAPR
ncbi:MAG: O-antigen ligase family protein [Pseudomonadota bacterium]